MMKYTLFMIKSKYLSFTILTLVIFGMIFIRGCAQDSTRQKDITKTISEEYVAYSNTRHALDRPVNWEVEENGAFTYFKSPLDEDSNDLQENVVIDVAPVGEPGQNLIDFFQDSVEILMATTPEFALVSHREDKFGGVPAYRIVYTEGEESAQTKYLQVFAVKGNNTHIVTYTAPAETFDKYLPEAEAIISSYRIK